MINLPKIDVRKLAPRTILYRFETKQHYFHDKIHKVIDHEDWFRYEKGLKTVEFTEYEYIGKIEPKFIGAATHLAALKEVKLINDPESVVYLFRNTVTNDFDELNILNDLTAVFTEAEAICVKDEYDLYWYKKRNGIE